MILPVSNEIEINSSKKILWNLISSPEHLNLVHPFCKKNKIIKWDKNERKDILIYLNNLRYIREFHIWNENWLSNKAMKPTLPFTINTIFYINFQNLIKWWCTFTSI